MPGCGYVVDRQQKGFEKKKSQRHEKTSAKSCWEDIVGSALSGKDVSKRKGGGSERENVVVDVTSEKKNHF